MYKNNGCAVYTFDQQNLTIIPNGQHIFFEKSIEQYDNLFLSLGTYQYKNTVNTLK